MPAREIPPPQWYSFLGNFGFRHFGWNVTLEQKSPGRGKHLVVNHSFLEELTTDVADGQQQITIVLGTPFQPFHTHVVSNPLRVRVVAGAQAALEIESADGSTIVVHLRRQDCAA
ncbi:MAG TPA: DUF5335 family protein [Terriglobales bacterium]